MSALALLHKTLDKPKPWLLSHGEYTLITHENAALQSDVAQVIQGVPLPYVLGTWEFYGHTFMVNPSVLIPRPETELLVEIALQYAKNFRHPCIIDVGTGSGAIAISLALELPSAHIIGVDLSLAALQVAQANINHLCPGSVSLLQADLLSPFSGHFDVVCANLPYIPSHTLQTLPVARWEPQQALDGGNSGLDSIERFLRQAQSRLSSQGMILLEIEASIGSSAKTLCQHIYPYAHHQIIKDLAGHDRILVIEKNSG